MTPQTASYTELIERLVPEATLTLHGVSWESYEDLLEAVGEAPPVRINYNNGVLQIMTTSFEHEYFAEVIRRLIDRLSIHLNLKVLFFGRATMKRQAKLKGAEPDACFYIQHAAQLGGRFRLDLTSDPPPDLVAEVDIRHDSQSKLPIYAGLGVPEVWRYDSQKLTIYLLDGEHYTEAKASGALPILTETVLTDFLHRSQQEDQHETLLAFEQWLRAQEA